MESSAQLTAYEAFAIVAGAASILGVGLAVRYARQSAAKVKRLVYDISHVRSPITSSRELRSSNLSVMYQHADGREERLSNVMIQHLVFANFGREPIRRMDLSSANPLRVVVEGARVLDMSLEVSRRSESQITLGTPSPENGVTTVPVTFDFLDHQDGALIRIVTDARPKTLRLDGTIIGMPAGIERAGESTSSFGRKVLSAVGATLSTLFVLAGLAATPIAYRLTQGSWEDVWLLALPLISLVVPPLIIAVIASTVWPSDSGPSFPKELMPRHVLAFWAPSLRADDVAMHDFRRSLRLVEEGMSLATGAAVPESGPYRSNCVCRSTVIMGSGATAPPCPGCGLGVEWEPAAKV